MIKIYCKTSCAEHNRARGDIRGSAAFLNYLFRTSQTGLRFLTFAILLVCSSTSFAIQETSSRPLRPTPDPYFNPKRQEFSSSRSLQQNLIIDRTKQNPNQQADKPEAMLSSSPEGDSVNSGNTMDAGRVSAEVQTLPAWEPPIGKAALTPNRKSDLLKPLATTTDATRNAPSIIRNGGNAAPPVVGDFSGDLSNFKKLQPSNRAGLKPVPETKPSGSESADQPSSFQLSPRSSVSASPSPQVSKEDDKSFRPSAGLGGTGGITNPIVQDKPRDSSLELDKQANIEKPDSKPDSPGSSDSTKPVDSGYDPRLAMNETIAMPDLTAAGPKQEVENSSSGSDSEIEPTRLLAMVGKEPIFVADMLYEINQMIDKFMPGAPPAIRERETKNAIPMLLGKFVDSKLLYVDTLRKLPEGVDLDKVFEQAGREFDEKVVQAMMEETGSRTAADLEAHFRVQGTSLRKFRQTWCKDQLTRHFVSEQLEVEKEVTHHELLEEYKNRFDQYAIPAKARWEQISIRFDRTSSKSEAEQQIAEIGKKILHGANFGAIARKESHGFTASEGGMHDWTGKGSLASEELDKALFTLPVGKLSGILETKDGFHIIRVTERTEATHKPFLEAQEEIKEAIQEKKRRDAFEKYVAKVRKEIPVEYYIQTPTMPTAQKPQSGNLVR